MEECFDKSCDGGKLLLGQHEGGKGEIRENRHVCYFSI